MLHTYVGITLLLQLMQQCSISNLGLTLLLSQHSNAPYPFGPHPVTPVSTAMLHNHLGIAHSNAAYPSGSHPMAHYTSQHSNAPYPFRSHHVTQVSTAMFYTYLGVTLLLQLAQRCFIPNKVSPLSLQLVQQCSIHI